MEFAFSGSSDKTTLSNSELTTPNTSNTVSENAMPELSAADLPADQISKHPHLPEESILLRVFISEGDRFDHQPLADAIVLRARKFGLAGATVLTGRMGFGKSSRMHTQKHLRISTDLPVVIEIVDIAAKIETFLPVLDAMMGGGLVTLERAHVIRYGQKKPYQKRRWF